jgi:RNA polymerase sigma-70 factor (ECF subfamily)
MAWDIALDPPLAALRDRPVRSVSDDVRRDLRAVNDVERRLKALMLLGLAGDASAQTALLDDLARRLRAYFARRLGADSADLEDLVQESLIAIHLKRHTYDQTQPFTPWAYAIARYKLIDHLRRSRSHREAPLDDALELTDPNEPQDPDAALDLARLLAALPERQRRLVTDVKITGLSIDEVSRKSGLSPSAVKVGVHRAVGAMARRFRDANR